jgi:alkylation response protein AidB-like acyl-CoA dehydrogenase
MDFTMQYTDGQEAFRATVRDWLDAHVPVELRGVLDHHEPPAQYGLRRELGRELGARGWLYPMAPIEYGGGGLAVDEALVIIEEMRRLGLALPPYYDSGGSIGSAAIRVWGTDEQKARLLPPIFRGDQRTWQLLTEPGAGSDLAAASTSAVRDGDDWRITGEKVFIGSDHGADALWTIVRTGDPSARHHNLSWFMIPADAPGVTITPMRLIGGDDKNTIHFDDVLVRGDNLVGGVDEGWKVASTHLELEHGLRPESMPGVRLNALYDAVAEQWTQRCSEPARSAAGRAHARDMLAQAYVRKETVRLLGLRNFWLSSTNQPRTYEGSQAYLLEKFATQWFSEATLQILGPDATIDREGTTSSALVAQSHVGSIYTMHGGGTAEIQKMIIARRLGLGRERAEEAGRLR